jgi:diguanylate cyclase (GGDEF)-like protein
MNALAWIHALTLGAALAVLGWGMTTGPLRIFSRSSRDFLGFNLLVMAGALCWWPWGLTESVGSAYLVALGVVLHLAGVQALCAGLQKLHDLRPTYALSPMMLPMLATVLAGVAWLDATAQGLMLAGFSACVWMLALTVQLAFPSLRARSGRVVARWSLLPLLVAGVCWGVGMLRSVWLLLAGAPEPVAGGGAPHALLDPLQMAAWMSAWWVLNAALAGLMMLKLLDKIRDLTTEDELTGTLNFRSFMAMLNHERERLRRHPTPQVLMVCELDQLSEMNRQLGFSAGDTALRHVTGVMGRGLRKTDRLGRSSSDEFLFFLPDTPAMGAMLVAERMQSAMKANPFLWNGQSVALTLSVGLAERIHSDLPCEEWLQSARTATRRAQREGGGRIRLSQPDAANDPLGPGSTLM